MAEGLTGLSFWGIGFGVQGLGPAPAPYSSSPAPIPKPETLNPKPDEFDGFQGLGFRASGPEVGAQAHPAQKEASCVGSSLKV